MKKSDFHEDHFQLVVPEISEAELIEMLQQAGELMDSADVPTEGRMRWNPEMGEVEYL